MPGLYAVAWYVFRFLYAIYFGWRVRHPDRVPLTGPVILASNHASFLDPPLVCAGITRLVHCLGRESLFRFPGLGWVLRQWKVVPVNREGGGAAGLKAIMDRLKAGAVILLFPEGTRTRDGRLQAARSGIGLTVLRSSAPVIPVRVSGTFAAFGRDHWFPRPRRVAISYGVPLTFDRERAEARICPKARLKVLYQEVADAIMAAIAGLPDDPGRP